MALQSRIVKPRSIKVTEYDGGAARDMMILDAVGDPFSLLLFGSADPAGFSDQELAAVVAAIRR